MKNWNWRKQITKIDNSPTSNFDITKHLFMDHYELVRKDVGTLPITVPDLFELYGDGVDEQTISQQQIIDKMIIPMEERIPSTPPKLRTEIGISNMEVGPAYIAGSHPVLTVNTEYDTNIGYNDGNNFNAVCFYYICERNKNVMGGFYEFQDIVERTLTAEAYRVNTGGATIYSAGRNLNTYYSMVENGSSSIDIRNHFKIGNLSHLCDNGTTLNKVRVQSNYYIADIFNLSTTNPFYYSGNQIVSFNLGMTSWYGTGPYQWDKNPQWLTQFPVIKYGTGIFVPTEGMSNTYELVYLVIGVKEGFNAVRRKIF